MPRYDSQNPTLHKELLRKFVTREPSKFELQLNLSASRSLASDLQSFYQWRADIRPIRKDIRSSRFAPRFRAIDKNEQSHTPTDPATDDLITNVAELSAVETEDAIKAAYAALPGLRRMTGRERANLLKAWHKQIQDNAEDLATLITWENGKPLADAKGEVAYANSFFEWFAEEAPRMDGQTLQASGPGKRVYTTREPVGVCGLITP
jgi:hypothetical protein